MKAVIYTLRCPESGAVRYVGKCVRMKARLRQHISDARIGKIKSHKCAWIRSLLNRGLRPVMALDVEIEEWQNWKAVEIERVAYYRGIGCDLTNGTDGGDSPGELTEEGKKILSERASKRFGSPEGRRRQSEFMKKLCQSPEWRAARDAAAKATRSTPEYKAKMSERAKAKWLEPGYRERSIASSIAARSDPEYRRRLSESIKRAQSDPAVRAQRAESTRAAWASGRMKGRAA